MKKIFCYPIFVLISLISLSSCGTSKRGLDYAALVNASQLLGMDIDYNDNHGLYLEAAQWIGTPYRSGGNTKKGTDCSGFTSQVYNNVYRIQLPRSSKDQFKAVKKVHKRKLDTGDLVFFSTDRSRKNISHVGIYLKQGKFIHASTSSGVIVSKLNEPYYMSNWISGGKIKN